MVKSLHSFPTNLVSRTQWIKQIRTTRKDCTEPTSDKRDSQVVDPASKMKESFGIKTIRRLLPNAVPSVFSHQVTQSICTPDQQKSRITAGLTTHSPRGAFQKRERARVLKEIFQNQHPEDNVQERTQKTPITQSTVDGVTYPEYVKELMAALEEMVKKPEFVDRQLPPPLCSQFQRPDKSNAVQAHKSRFAR